MQLLDKHIVITGGTGSLGRALVQTLTSGAVARPRAITVFSRGEVKQHKLRLEHQRREAATDETIYHKGALRFVIGDVRDYAAVCDVLRTADVVIHAAALKQVPTCEYAPYEAMLTNVLGAQHIVRAIREHRLPVQVVVGVSSDKAVQPVNVYGMTKAIQERIFCTANLGDSSTRFVCVRYGNVLDSRGSVVPLFREQIQRGGPVTITCAEMTRFWQGLDDAVAVILAAIKRAQAGEVWVRQVASARIMDLARVMIGDASVEIQMTEIRPGEKIHEVLVSREECTRTRTDNGHYVIAPLLPELRGTASNQSALIREYTSADNVVSCDILKTLLRTKGVIS